MINSKAMQEIKYVGFYTIDQYKDEHRASCIAAINKMDYICDALNELGYRVKIIAPAWITHPGAGYTKRHKTRLTPQKELILCPSFGTKSRWLLYVNILLALSWLLFYLIKNTKRGEKIFVYHSPWLCIPIRMAQFFKRFEIVLEVEEIYYNTILIRPCFRTIEDTFLKNVNAYILSTILLKEKIGIKQNFIICNGTYKPIKQIGNKFEDGKIHVVYAGIIDQLKRGAFIALDMASFLSSHYHIHILGFGTEEDLSLLQKEMNIISKKTSCTITYDGLYTGDDYFRFIQRCHIGLSTQNPNADYNETSFPSKVLSYLTNGLRVVSIRIKALETSVISDLLDYYDKNDPESIARVIENLDTHVEYDGRKKLEKIHERFKGELKQLIENN
jgi:hypothetical protein